MLNDDTPCFGDVYAKAGPRKPNEPTLTCSERVECKESLEKALALVKVRQGSEAEFERLLAHALATFAEKKNRCHLAELSRRERRVQELEACLRQIVRTQISGKPDSMLMQEVIAMAQDALANSEQIRKGAKHE